MKTLFVGDPHLQIGKLEASHAFTGQLLRIIQEQKPEQTVIAGDLFHTFAVIRSEILSLWWEFLEAARHHTRLVLLVGNHDLSGPDGGTHALEVFRAFAQVVDRPEIIDGINYFPFMRDNAEFERLCRALPAGSGLMCHQSFNGAQFENGFYDPHGADTAAVAHLGYVVSGHVHKAQRLGNIWYPGTPYQMSFADAGEPKHVYLLDIGPDQVFIQKEIELDMPTYTVLRAESPKELVESLPVPRPQNHYKFVAEGTHQEIQEFWKDERVRAFRAGAGRVEDCLVLKRAASLLPKVEGQNLQEKVNGFIQQRQWRTAADHVAAAAATLLGQ
jgi:DNA repair exonuclease SbcCD nuclease subunit